MKTKQFTMILEFQNGLQPCLLSDSEGVCNCSWSIVGNMYKLLRNYVHIFVLYIWVRVIFMWLHDYFNYIV